MKEKEIKHGDKKNSGFIKNILDQDLNLLNNNSIENKINKSKTNRINYELNK